MVDKEQWEREYRSPRKIIEKERKRLLDIPDKPDFDEWLDGRQYPLDWMKRGFGETLVEISAEEIFEKNKTSNVPYFLCSSYIYCSFCHKDFELDETFVHANNDGEYEEYSNFDTCEECMMFWL